VLEVIIMQGCGNNENFTHSKKTFFLFADRREGEWLEKKTCEHEYESYCITDHAIIHDILKRYNNSILIINTFEVPCSIDLIHMVQKIKEIPETGGTTVGAIIGTGDNDGERSPFYDFEIPIQNDKKTILCEKTLPFLINALEKEKARGRRKYLRVKCTDYYKATFSIKIEKKLFTGFIKDISTAGICANFTEAVKWVKGSIFSDMQLRLNGTTCGGVGKVVGSHTGDDRSWVILFENNGESWEKEKIRSFIHTTMKKQLDEIIRSLHPN